MWMIVLISGDPKTHSEITALLPKGAGLEKFSTLNELPRPTAAPVGRGYSDKIVVIELTGTPPALGRIEPFRLAGIPLVALIGSPVQRESALHAGFDDYLLRPISAAEFKKRLDELSLRHAAGIQRPPIDMERERQAAVGRLTSYFCHAVNNSMQTIRGAIDLALEEPNLPSAVAEYLTISRKETGIIGGKIDRLRQIYRPKATPPEEIAPDALLRESLNMATDDLLRNNVSVREQVDSALPSIHGSHDRLALAFLMMIFHLSEKLGGRGGGELRLQAGRERGFLQVTFCAIPGSGGGEASAITPDSPPSGLEPAQELIRSERGQMQAFHRDNGFCLQVRFPAGGS